MGAIVKVGRFDVYDSGTILAGFEDTVSFSIENVRFSLVFITDSETSGPGLGSETRGENHLAILLKNFTNPLGSGVKEPLRVGSLGDRSLYLSFWIYTHGHAKTREIAFTFYLGEAANGETAAS